MNRRGVVLATWRLMLADMVCRHEKGDPNCSSSPNYIDYSAYSAGPSKNEPKPDEAIPVEVARVGPHLVLKVQYPSCRHCAYEGNKVLVYLNVSEIDAIKWRYIDPHFKDPKKPVLSGHAPAPVARFPASPQGWEDALAYARMKSQPGFNR